MNPRTFKMQLSADFQSRRLLPSRLRVSPSSRRKALFSHHCASIFFTNPWLPPGGSCREATEGESVTDGFLKPEAMKESLKNEISNPTTHKTENFCCFSVPQAPFVTLARDTFLSKEGFFSSFVSRENTKQYSYLFIHKKINKK